jgi:plasmid stabilization system protein ParE
MKILWSEFASENLTEIYKYYKEVAGESIARRIKNEVFYSVSQLIQYPQSGQIEISLSGLNEGHRYLVSGNYKIIYKEVIEGILITDIFDTRQDPKKMNDPKRKTLR